MKQADLFNIAVFYLKFANLRPDPAEVELTTKVKKKCFIF